MSVAMALNTLREKAGEANELHRLRDRVEELEHLLGLVSKTEIDRFVALNLEPMERKILNVMFGNKLAGREHLYTVLYGNKPECDQPMERVLNTYVCRLRKYLAQFDIQIHTQRGDGWFMTEVNKKALADLADALLNGEKR